MKIYPPKGVDLYRTGPFARPTEADLDNNGYVLYWARSLRAWKSCLPDSLVAGDIWRKHEIKHPDDATLDIANQFYRYEPNADS